MRLKATKAGTIGGVILALFCSAAAQQSPQTSAWSVDAILQELQNAQAAVRPQVSYQVIREYRLFGSKNSKADSEVVAEVNFKPPATKDYRIQSSSGSSRGPQLVRHILDHEVEVASRNHKANNAISRDNYDISFAGEQTLDGRPCYVLGLKPKRVESDLISGKVWIDQRSFLIRQIEGDVQKTPSWWLKRLHVKLVFNDLEGIWVQTNMEAVADVRIVGSHTLTSHIIDYRKQSEVAVTPIDEDGSLPKR